MKIFKTSALTTIALSATIAISGCGASDASEGSGEPESVFGHVHGIAVNPGDGGVYVASHSGVFRLVDGEPELIADRRQDTMGFTIAGPDEFLASGHPASDSSEPNPLGFISSDDRANSWTSLSFRGQEDFHSIDVAGDKVYAYGAEGQVLASADGGRTWRTILQGQLIDIAADPTAPDHLLATTETGTLIAFTAGEDPVDVSAAPPMVFVDRTASGGIVGIDPSGGIFASTDDGVTWRKLTSLKSRPEALSVRSGTWYVATDAGLFQSKDKGTRWEPLLRSGS